MKRIALAIFAVVTALAATASFAGRYELVDGEGIAVCEAYKRNFESFDYATPMACEREYNPTVKGFSSPTWERLDLEKYLALYKKAGIYLQETQSHLSEADIQEGAKHAAEQAKALKAELYLAHLDLNGTGKLINILAIREKSCGPYHTGERTRLCVLNDTLTDIDYARQRSWGGYDSNATIELYQGRPYIEAYNPDDGWGSLFTKSGRFYVFRELSPQEKVQGYYPHFRLKTICEFQYVPSGETQ